MKGDHLEIEEVQNEFHLTDYEAQQVKLVFENPQFNHIEVHRLAELLDYRETSDFAQGSEAGM